MATAEALPPGRSLTGPSSPRRSVCAPWEAPHRPADRPKESLVYRNRRTALVVVVLGGALLATLASTHSRRRGEVRFASAEELLRVAREEGLHCYPGSPLPLTWTGYFVT